MEKVLHLTEREEQVMNFMWSYGRPVTSNDILELCTDRTWKDSYLQIMLRSLKNKGAIKVCGRILYNTQYAHVLVPTLSKEQYYLQLAFKRGVDRENFIRLAVNMANEMDHEGTEALLSSLREMLCTTDEEKKD